MARIIPDIRVEDIPNRGEREVARALVEQLPDDCLVYHSHPWLRPRRDYVEGHTVTKYETGEADFVVVIPGQGLLVIEVKAGDIGHDNERGRWYRTVNDGEQDIQNPFRQADMSRHVLVESLTRQHYHNKDRIPFAHGYAVVFPDCDFEGSTPPNADRNLIFGPNHLRHIDEACRAALRRWEPHARMDADDLEALKAVLQPHFRLVPALRARVEGEGEDLLRLTEQQARILDLLGNRTRAAIQGVAGAGKTLIALQQATRFAEQGYRTLFLCYNKALSEHIRLTRSDFLHENITVRHYHALCDEWCKRARIPFDPPQLNADAFWRSHAPELLYEATARVEDRFDAVVVDEAQDYLPDWWAPIEEINTGGRLFVFYDPDQDLFTDGQGGPPTDLGEPFLLNQNCRNTVAITRKVSEIVGREIANLVGAPVGTTPVVLVAETDEAQREVVAGLLKEWCGGKSPLDPSMVAILSTRRIETGPFKGIESLGGVNLVREIGPWIAGEGAILHTMQGFKGLEAHAVIVIDYREPSDEFWRTVSYVGVSRACNMLAFVSR